MPLFLESDFYFQYRLAKVISQARLFNDKKEFVVMKIDFTPRQKKVKKSVRFVFSATSVYHDFIFTVVPLFETISVRQSLVLECICKA